MKRKRILNQIWLYFLMLMLLLAAGCSSSNDNNTPTPTPTQKLITISGTVTTAGGIPVSGVVMSAMIDLAVMNITLFEGSFDSNQFSIVITGADGTYSLTVPADLIVPYTIVLTPAKKGYTFSPADSALTIGTTDQTGVNFTATAVTEYSQADLITTWRINLLRTGTENKWLRARIRIADASGNATCLSMSDSEHPPATDLCPVAPATFNLKFTVGSDGVITQSGADAFGNNDNMTMNSAKNLMAGTAGYGTSFQLMIAQKDTVSSTATALTSLYKPGYVDGANFVFHSLGVGRVLAGGTNEWRYGTGATGATGVISIGDEFNPGGPATTPLAGTTMSLDYTGLVTIANAGGTGNDFVGFLSGDLRTIVGTYSAASLSPLAPDCKLLVIQINDDQTTNEMTGSSVNHLLAVDAHGDAMFWGYHDVNISRIGGSLVPDILDLSVFVNIMLSYNWELSTSLTDIQKLALINLEKINISNNGEAIIRSGLGTTAHPYVTTFHGQLGYDGTFMVGVRTKTMPVEGVDTDFYTLNVITH